MGIINKTEIEIKSKELAISTSDIQRDFLFGHLLNYIFTQSPLRTQLFLKGGNALRKAYFVNTRFSSDLDFGMDNDIEMTFLEGEIRNACKYISERVDISFVQERNRVEEKFGKWKEDRWKVFEVNIYFKDFYGNPERIVLKISLDITRFDKHYLPIVERPLIHPYSDNAEVVCSIRCAQLEEIIATKLKCLMQRDYPPDLYDFLFSVYLNSEIALDKKQVREVFLKRTIFENNPGVAKKILLSLPLEYLKAAWSKSIVCTKDKFIDFEEAVIKFMTQIQELFADVPDSSWGDHYYFPPEFRKIILKAGKELTLIKIMYNHAERLIEPYALKFQERRDGTAKEYFYVYDRVGSKNNPDWKTYVAENTQSMENTDEKFEPQYPVELCRAGEHPEDRYLYNRDKKIEEDVRKIYKQVKPRTPKQRASRLSSLGPKYVFKCSSCGKLSYRKSNDGNLGVHKNKNGYPCYGYGIYQRVKY
jgi:predicted nucleotidyltransferase component of viral defense system